MINRIIGAALALLAAANIAIRCLPIPPALLRPPIQSVALLDRNGVPLREARVQERFSRELTLRDVPRHVIDAVLAAEDKRFFHHHGIDWLATGRALGNGLTSGHITSGASTITQQLIKISERRPRNLWTKISEAATALRLEEAWSKEQILCAYLNRVDFGNLNIGLASAADYYFGKPVADLSEAEGALLAGLPRNPRKLNPHVALERARTRQHIVLTRMRENGSLDANRFEFATNESLRLRPPRRLFRAPHFVDLALEVVAGVVDPGNERNADAQDQAGSTSPATTTTTLDLALNDEVERMLRDRLAQLRDHNVQNGAAVVIDNATGDVIALVGSSDYFAPGSGQVNGVWAKRSAGSTLKPFTYLLALERGATPASMVADVRTSFPSADGFYRPENYNRRCYGPVTYRTALASSLNIPAVKALLAAGGPEALHERLRTVGLTTLDHAPEIYGLGLTLGNCEARLLEIANAYASLARLGEWKPWRVLADAQQKPTSSRAKSRDPVDESRMLQRGPSTLLGMTGLYVRRYSQPELVWQIADIMTDNSARTLAFGINNALRFDFPVACKTGTSTDFRDNWTLGFTPEFTVGVWVGNFDGSPMREISGVSGAGPILHNIFEHLHAQRGTSWYPPPASIVTRRIHPLTGHLLGENDPRGVVEKFLPHNLPPNESRDDYDVEGRVKLPNEYSQWFASAENCVRKIAVLAGDASDLRIVSPLPESTYLLDPDVRSSRRIPLVATGGKSLIWESDSLGVSRDEAGPFATAREGEHQIAVIDGESGKRAQVRITVRPL